MALFSNPSFFPVNDDDFVPPVSGGTVAVCVGTVEYTDTSAKTLFTLPEGAVPLFWVVDITTDFDAGSSNDLELGIASNTDYFATAIDIGTVGTFMPDATNAVAGRLGVQLSASEGIVATYTPGGTAPAQGVANIILFYMLGGDMYVLD